MTRKREENFFGLNDGNQLYYQYTSNPDSEYVIVFLNGLSQSTQAWSGIAPALSEEYNILSVDLIFQGKSTAQGEFRTYDQHAQDVFALVESLQLRNVVLCGISYGSAVAQHALVNYPDRFSGGVLISTFAHSTPLFVEIGETWKTALQQGGYKLMLDIMLPFVLGASYFSKPVIPIEVLKELRTTANPEAPSLLNLMKATEVRGDYRNQLRQITKPVIVIQGEEDLLIPVAIAEEVIRHVTGSKMIVVDAAGHTLNLEAMEVLSAEIDRFIKGLN